MRDSDSTGADPSSMRAGITQSIDRAILRSSTLTIRTTAATPPGTYTLTITGTATANGGAGTVVRRTTFTLTVQ